MIETIKKVLKPVFIELDILDYLKVSYSEKADFQINSVFQIAKDREVNPIEFGEILVNKINELDNFSDIFKSVEFVRPGFINIFLSDSFINKALNEYINNGLSNEEKKEVYFLDYGGPNIAKPLHIGHLRPAIVGESIKRILKFRGYKVISDVHLGDFGLQIGQVIYGILKDKKNLEDIDIDYLNYIYPKMSGLCKSDSEVYAECKRITFQFQNGEYKEYYDKIKEVSLNDIKRIYNYLDISFDMWLGESDSKPFIDDLFKLLDGKKLLSLDDGAKVVHVKRDDDKKEMPPCMVLSSDGTFMYATSDLAALMTRMKDYKPDYVLYVTDPRQSLHFEQIFRVADMSGIKANAKLEHIPFGTINGSDGKPFKTRNGEALKLDELIKLTRENFISLREENKNMSEEDINIIVNAIIKYADLQNNREKSYNYDIAKFSDVSGKTGPYILYSALRIRKIINDNKVIGGNLSDKIYNDIDRDLRFKILEINKYVDLAIEDRLPSHVALYLYDLCDLINTFYQNINISKIEDESVRNDYLNLLSLALKVIESCLDMLIIKLPSVM